MQHEHAVCPQVDRSILYICTSMECMWEVRCCIKVLTQTAHTHTHRNTNTHVHTHAHTHTHSHARTYTLKGKP